MDIGNIWQDNNGWRHRDALACQAATLSARYLPPLSQAVWEERRSALRAKLHEMFLITRRSTALDIEVHKSIPRQGYRIDLISYASDIPEIRITAALYVPEGEGPFPAIINMHGHGQQGKSEPAVQARGHLMAQNGYVVLSPDTVGAGERSRGFEEFVYHGGTAGAGLYLSGDSLMGWQVRDNRRGVDLLTTLPYVNPDLLGATGGSGGGNQTKWLAACDERVKTAVPVVSTGAFQYNVTRCNCICETFPGGLTLFEEWEILGLMAPRPLLIMNAEHDSSPSFSPPAAQRTYSALKDLYQLWQARENCELRIFDCVHGYKPEMLPVLLDWMNRWLKGTETRSDMVEIEPENREDLRCLDKDTWIPEVYSYAAQRQQVLKIAPEPKPNQDDNTLRQELVRITGFKTSTRNPKFLWGQGSEGLTDVVVWSERGIPLPIVIKTPNSPFQPLELIFSSEGKSSDFARRHFNENAAAAVVDLPGQGELSWESTRPRPGNAKLHDTGRACLWLGHTLAGEWAECVSAIVRWASQRFSVQEIRIRADGSAALATLIAATLDESVRQRFREVVGLPESFKSIYDEMQESTMAMIVPGIIPWGDIGTLHRLAETEAYSIC